MGPRERPGTAWAVDLPPGVWHTLAVLTPHAVVVEVKPGFYDPATDKQFAPWAPREGEPGARDYLKKLLALATAGRDVRPAGALHPADLRHDELIAVRSIRRDLHVELVLARGGQSRIQHRRRSARPS